MIALLSRCLRCVTRVLRRQPASAVAAILTIGLAVGLNTTIFSVVNGVLLKPLPYTDPDRLVLCGKGEPGESTPLGLSEPEYYDWAERNRAFQAMAASAGTSVDLIGGTVPEPMKAERITASLLPLLGVRPILGRGFVPSEQAAGEDKVVIVSEGVWRTLLGADPHVVGKQIRLKRYDGEDRYTIVGVTPAAFRLKYSTSPESFEARTGRGVDLFLPLVGEGNRGDSGLRKTASYRVYARLKTGVSLSQARSLSVGLQEQLTREYPASIQGLTAVVQPLHEAIFGSTRRAVLVLIIAVALVLLVACANVASLMLARGAALTQELAIRSTLGAARVQLFARMFSESLLLALMGGVLGLLLATWLTAVARAILPTEFPRASDIRIDVVVLLFTAGCSLLTGLLFGFVPAWRASRADVAHAIKVQAGSTDRAGVRFQNALITAECAFVTVLCCSAGLFVNSYSRMVGTHLGIDVDDVVTMLLRVPDEAGSDFAHRRRFDERLLASVRQLPGVMQASTTSDLPFSTGGLRGFLLPGEARMQFAETYCVEPTYTSLIGLRVIRGRGLHPSDQQGQHRVAVINKAAADAYFHERDPIGQRLTMRDDYEIVGVVSNHVEMVNATGLRAGFWRDAANTQHIATATPPAVYIPSAQASWNAWLFYLVVRTGGRPEAVVSSIRKTIAQLEPNLAVKETVTGDDWRSISTAETRFFAAVLAAFALLVLVLASVGIYGVVAQAVGRRTREIGIRIALGATTARVAMVVLSQTVVVLTLGLIIGIAAAAGTTRLLRRFLFDVAPGDPLTFALVSLVLLATCCAAAWLPTRRASRIDPIHALRSE